MMTKKDAKDWTKQVTDWWKEFEPLAIKNYGQKKWQYEEGKVSGCADSNLTVKSCIAK